MGGGRSCPALRQRLGSSGDRAVGRLESVARLAELAATLMTPLANQSLDAAIPHGALTSLAAVVSRCSGARGPRGDDGQQQSPVQNADNPLSTAG